MNLLRRLVVGMLLALLPLAAALAEAATPNVLFITIDDLRPELGCYGQEQVLSPHIDRIAAQGMVFNRAYSQQAICNASRASLMTGLRPNSTGVYDLVTHFRTKVPNVVTLPQQFKAHGYRSESFGKIYHPAFPGYGIGSDLGDPPSWSQPAWLPGPRYYYSPLGVKLARQAYADAIETGPRPGAPNWVAEVLASRTANPEKAQADDAWTKVNVRVLATEAPEVSDNVLYGGQVTDHALAALDRLVAPKADGKMQPFFLAVGYLKPHLPFIAPRKYWDLYDPEKIDVASNPTAPEDVPSIAMETPLDELRDTYPVDVRVPAPGESDPAEPKPYRLHKDRPLSRDEQINLRRGYYACISYVDAQIGRLVDELKRKGVYENTIIVILGDHGFHLGEHGLWGKLTNFEVATRVPLIIAAPGLTMRGQKAQALVELVDVYPTLCDLAGLPKPADLEGTSLLPLLSHPRPEWKKAAFSQYPRPGVTGYSIRTDRYRLTCWQKTDHPDEVVGMELYDHRHDPGENLNLATDPDHAGLVHRLAEELRAGWKAALPSSGNLSESNHSLGHAP